MYKSFDSEIFEKAHKKLLWIFEFDSKIETNNQGSICK